MLSFEIRVAPLGIPYQLKEPSNEDFEVSDKYNITPDTLRYYERVGLIPYVHRNKSGVRDYTEDDQNWIEFITLMRSAGFPVEVLQHYVELCKQEMEQ